MHSCMHGILQVAAAARRNALWLPALLVHRHTTVRHPHPGPRYCPLCCTHEHCIYRTQTGPPCRAPSPTSSSTIAMPRSVRCRRQQRCNCIERRERRRSGALASTYNILTTFAHNRVYTSVGVPLIIYSPEALAERRLRKKRKGEAFVLCTCTLM